jgi:hypothetical protein
MNDRLEYRTSWQTRNYYVVWYYTDLKVKEFQTGWLHHTATAQAARFPRPLHHMKMRDHCVVTVLRTTLALGFTVGGLPVAIDSRVPLLIY